MSDERLKEIEEIRKRWRDIIDQAATARRPVLTPELAELKKLAEASTHTISMRMLKLRMGSGLRAYFIIDKDHHTPFEFEIETNGAPASVTGERFKAVTAFIAAANPQTILKLIQTLALKEEEMAGLRAKTIEEDRLAEARRGSEGERVCFYEREFYVLSNFSAFKLMWKGFEFDTSEAAYHWEKFPSYAEVRDSIRFASSAHEAFKTAEKYKAMRRPDWDVVKLSIMKAILIEKALQHEYVRRKLLETGDRKLVEDSWRDDFWGWGPNRDGLNMLGKLWMEIRAEFRATGEREMSDDVCRALRTSLM